MLTYNAKCMTITYDFCYNGMSDGQFSITKIKSSTARSSRSTHVRSPRPTHIHSPGPMPVKYLWLAQKLRTKNIIVTNIPKRTIKNIGKMLQVSKCWGEIDNEVLSKIKIIYKYTYSIKSALGRKLMTND